MKTVKDLLQLSSQYLEKHHVERPKRVVEEILASVLQMKRMDLYMNFNKPVEEAEIQVLRDLLRRAKNHEPVQYIVGEVPFYHCSISLSPDVLIPRPETEELVELAIKCIDERSEKSLVLADVCTGSGCIAIAIKKARPHVRVIATDISNSALEIAKKNAERNNVKIDFYQGDFLSALPEKVDILLCNPPYISETEYLSLSKSVRDFEPKNALIAKEDGMFFYQRLAQDLPSFLESKGQVIVELGFSQGQAVQNLFTCSIWHQSRLIQDLANHDRFFFLEIQ